MTTPIEHHTHTATCFWDVMQARWSCSDRGTLVAAEQTQQHATF